MTVSSVAAWSCAHHLPQAATSPAGATPSLRAGATPSVRAGATPSVRAGATPAAVSGSASPRVAAGATPPPPPGTRSGAASPSLPAVTPAQAAVFASLHDTMLAAASTPALQATLDTLLSRVSSKDVVCVWLEPGVWCR